MQRDPLAPSEADIQATLIEAAMTSGWMVAHFRPAKTERGWRTPVEGHAGFPDLVLARNGRVYLWELKGPRGTLSHDQQTWLRHLGLGQPVEAHANVITPGDLDAALELLRRKR